MRTDIHIYQWNEYASSRIKLPLLFRHEYAADVVEVGKNAGHFKKATGWPPRPTSLRALLPVHHRAAAATSAGGGGNNCRRFQIPVGFPHKNPGRGAFPFFFFFPKNFYLLFL